MSEPNWRQIAYRLAHALRTVENEPFRLKNWHRAYDALTEYDEAVRSTYSHNEEPEIY